MTIEEYIAKAKRELDEMREEFINGHKKDPENWPLETDEEEWAEQELAFRFARGGEL